MYISVIIIITMKITMMTITVNPQDNMNNFNFLGQMQLLMVNFHFLSICFRAPSAFMGTPKGACRMRRIQQGQSCWPLRRASSSSDGGTTDDELKTPMSSAQRDENDTPTPKMAMFLLGNDEAVDLGEPCFQTPMEDKCKT